MKISKLETVLLSLTAATLVFFTGWYLGARSGAQPYAVYTSLEAGSSPASPAVTQRPAPGLREGERININTASAADLTRLPGIGEKRAAEIVAYREANGPFDSVEKLVKVPGIGEKILQSLMDYITVDEE